VRRRRNAPNGNLPGRNKKGKGKVTPEKREYACYVLVFTTLSKNQASTRQVLECYRLRWQIELTFKRLKSVVQLGHIPKPDDQSSRAWLYGKLFVALLSQKLARIGSAISPWGYYLAEEAPLRSRWREFQFAFHRVLEAITPAVGLKTTIIRWNEIAAALGERNRKRKPQIANLRSKS
jgi:hypothetical protein